MFDFLRRIFTTKNIIKFNILEFEKENEVGDWYKSGSGMAIRLSNIYTNKGKTYITIEFPKKHHTENRFYIQKDDGYPPNYLKGWIKINKQESEKLEKSYWKTIEKELEMKTRENKKEYNDFLKVANK